MSKTIWTDQGAHQETGDRTIWLDTVALKETVISSGGGAFKVAWAKNSNIILKPRSLSA